MLGWGRRQENVTILFFFPSLFFLGLVICSFIHRKYIGFFLFYGLKVNLIYIRGPPPLFSPFTVLDINLSKCRFTVRSFMQYHIFLTGNLRLSSSSLSGMQDFLLRELYYYYRHLFLIL